jgi:hypothetical protein
MTAPKVEPFGYPPMNASGKTAIAAPSVEAREAQWSTSLVALALSNGVVGAWTTAAHVMVMCVLS